MAALTHSLNKNFRYYTIYCRGILYIYKCVVPIFNLNLLSCCRKVLKSNKCIFLFIEGFENSFSSVIHLLSSLLIQIYNAKAPTSPNCSCCSTNTRKHLWMKNRKKKEEKEEEEKETNENTKLKIWKLRFSSTFGKCLQPFQINLPRQWDTMNKAPLQKTMNQALICMAGFSGRNASLLIG